MIEHTTTNQKQAAVTEGSMEGMCARAGSAGKRDTIVFEGGKVKGW